ncbi:TPA: hypothetical protein N0F65_004517 [Lagenidium giganteum]|uniref:Uncharacterized protein n=1 Tax=Lagenidium giganteum TaxID=4803 RepID=A0AAV2YTL9_9STRA|nr:TPA: hypothetical protein N0F65_004517 [Lagenidium giganteum]
MVEALRQGALVSASSPQQHQPFDALTPRQERHPSLPDHLLERVLLLEQQNAYLHEELGHTRLLLSNNSQLQDDDKIPKDALKMVQHLTSACIMITMTVSDEVNRLSQALASKCQNDMLLQQRDQQKAALLFAEGLDVLDTSFRAFTDESRLRSDHMEQRLAAAMQHHANSASSTEAAHELAVMKHHNELDQTVAILQNQLTQLRADIEAERNERWQQEQQRSQWVADLRAALTKTDASIETRMQAQMERIGGKLAADKSEIVRMLDEQRGLVTAYDLKRISTQMMEFSRINDHMLALERWVHTEHGHIRRIMQWVLTEIESRSLTLVTELTAVLTSFNQHLHHAQDDVHACVTNVQQAINRDFSVLHRKVNALEEVMPLEVQARQKSDDKLRRRLEDVIKSLSRAISTVRDQATCPDSNLAVRVADLEQAQQSIVATTAQQHDVMKETIEAFVRDSDAMLARVAAQIDSTPPRTSVPQDNLVIDHIRVASEAAAINSAQLKELEQTYTSANAHIRTQVKRMEQAYTRAVSDVKAFATYQATTSREEVATLKSVVTAIQADLDVKKCIGASVDSVVERTLVDQMAGVHRAVRAVEAALSLMQERLAEHSQWQQHLQAQLWRQELAGPRGGSQQELVVHL